MNFCFQHRAISWPMLLKFPHRIFANFSFNIILIHLKNFDKYAIQKLVTSGSKSYYHEAESHRFPTKY